MISSTDRVVDGALMGLTAKQRQVLDLLIQHKTSKEISRMLGISPHTVDQRIMLARAKLNVGTRGEVAQAYRLLLAETGVSANPDIYQRSVYGSPHIAGMDENRQDEWQEDSDAVPSHPQNTEPAKAGSIPRVPAQLRSDEALQPYYNVLPEAFNGQIGTLLRLGAIAMIAVFLTLIILGGLAIYSELSRMLDG